MPSYFERARFVAAAMGTQLGRGDRLQRSGLSLSSIRAAVFIACSRRGIWLFRIVKHPILDGSVYLPVGSSAARRRGFLGRRKQRPWFGDRVLQQAPECPHPVLPADFFPLFIRASPIADSHLVDSQAPFGDFDRDFRLEAKPVLLNRNTLNDVASKYLVTRLHVAQVDVRQAIGDER